MGRSESATLSIGIKIAIKDLFDSMNKENFDFVRDQFLTEESAIEDENGFYHGTFLGILNGYLLEEDESYLWDLPFEEYKEILTKKFKRFGESGYNNCGEEDYGDNENHLDCLYNQILLVPFHELLKMERGGYNREGCNGAWCPLKIDKLNDCIRNIDSMMEKFDTLDYEIVFNVIQHAG